MTRGQRGLTLVELIAALVISALAVALASRLYLTGHREFLARVFETDRLSAQIRLKGSLHQALAGEVTRCGRGALSLATDSVAADLSAWVKARFPEADSMAFRCLELDARGGELVEWKDRFQPQLVEYRVVLRTRGKRDELKGSVLR